MVRHNRGSCRILAHQQYKPRTVLAPMALILLMALFTLYSQFCITPAMERDRIAAGGVVDADLSNPSRIDFKKLHSRRRER